MKFINLFVDEKVPYLLTMILGLIAYQTNHITESLLKSPILEYKFKHVEEKIDTVGDKPLVERKINFVLTNISRDIAFKDLEFKIKYPTLDRNQEKPDLFYPDMIPLAPAYFNATNSVTFSDSIKHQSVTLYKNRSIDVKIHEIQPGMKYMVQFLTKSSPKDKIEFPFVYFDGNGRNDVILLKRESWETWFVQNQLLVSFYLLIFWFVIMGAYFLLYNYFKK